MNKKIIILSIAVFLFSANMVDAENFLLGKDYSAVDSGEIRWGGSTQYSTQWYAAINTWNALNKIKIFPDTWYTNEDLTVSDVNKYTGGWNIRYGFYSPSYLIFDSNKLYLNQYLLKNTTAAQKQLTATHELGHALGLGEHNIYYNVMYKYMPSNVRTTLGSQDITDYRYLWGY